MSFVAGDKCSNVDEGNMKADKDEKHRSFPT
jgi:hypothetical protein